MLPATRAVRKALFPVVDATGRVKSVIQLIVEEAVNAGIEEIGLVTAPEDEAVFNAYFSRLPGPLKSAIGNRTDLLEAAELPGELSDRLTCIIQDHPRGLGDAVRHAQIWAGNEPVLIMLGDHLYQSKEDRNCARQLLDTFETRQSPVSAVTRKSPGYLKDFGTVSGRPVPRVDGLYVIDTVEEKPEISLARERLRVDGLPEDTYLCWFGLHAMTPDLFGCLEKLDQGGATDGGELQLTAAQAMLAGRRAYYALEINGNHFDTGSPRGYAETVGFFAGKHDGSGPKNIKG